MNICKSRTKFIVAMLIFGSIGLFAKFINMPSAQIVLSRTIIGSMFLCVVLLLKGKRIDKNAVIKNLPVLILLGISLATSWLFLFESFKYTTVGITTVVYYLAPVIVFLLSPIIFKEKITVFKIFGILSAVVGIIIINFTPIGGTNPKKGILFALLSAFLYAILMILNKKLKNISGVDSTISQLIIAAFIIFCYLLFKGELAFNYTQKHQLFLLIFLGIFHTGFACYLFFSSITMLSAQNASLLSYIDPLSALIFSWAILGEKLSPLQMLGVVLILGGTLVGQISKEKLRLKQ